MNTNLRHKMNAAGRAGRRREAAGRAGRRREAALAAQVTSGGACAQEKIDEAAEDARVMRVQKEQATQQEMCDEATARHRIIQDALGSPGCTRAVITAKVLASTGLASAAGEECSRRG